MKSRFMIAMLILLLTAGACAQVVASHASTLQATPQAKPLPSSLQVSGKPVAKVNGAVLTDRDLLREMFTLFPYAKLHNGFPKQQEPEIRRGALQMIIFEELVYQEAVRRKMSISPERVLREEKKFKQQFSSQSEFNEYLKAEMGGSETKLRQQIKRSLLIDAMLKTEVDSKATVTATEARAYFEKNPKAFEHGETFAIQTISIIPPANANSETLKETEKRAQSILTQARATKNYEEFGLLAEKSSDDDYRVNMGDRKVVVRENLPPEVVKAIQPLKSGEMSGLIQLGTAYTIVRVNTHNPPGKPKFDDVKVELVSKLQKQKYEKLRVALDKRLHQNASIQEM